MYATRSDTWLWRDHRAPDRHVRLLRVRRLAEPVVDDRAQLAAVSEAVADVLQRGNVRGNAAFALLAVTGRARELDEQVRTHRDVRIARVRALAASPAATAGRAKAATTNADDDRADRRDVARRMGGEYPPRPSQIQPEDQSEPRSIRPAANSPKSPAMRPVARGGAGDVVLGAAKLEVSVPRRPSATDVAVERHADTARIDEVGPVRAPAAGTAGGCGRRRSCGRCTPASIRSSSSDGAGGKLSTSESGEPWT